MAIVTYTQRGVLQCISTILATSNKKKCLSCGSVYNRFGTLQRSVLYGAKGKLLVHTEYSLILLLGLEVQ